MRRIISSTFAVAALLSIGALPARAQDPYMQVQVLEVAPAEIPAFVDAVHTLIEAAKAADLSADFGWAVYSEGNRFHIVTGHASMTEFEDEEAFVREFQGTDGEALMGEAFAKFAGLDITGSNSLSRTMPEWSYIPEDGMPEEDLQGARVFQTWVRGDHEEAFDENAKAVAALLGEIGLPYPVLASRVVFGEGGLVTFALLHDGLANLYGENSFGGYLERSGTGEKWGELFQARREMIRRNDAFDVNYRADLSYDPGM